MEIQRVKHLVVAALAGAALVAFVGTSLAVGSAGQPSKADSMAAAESKLLLVAPLTRDELLKGVSQYDSVLSYSRATQFGFAVASTAAPEDVMVATGQPKKKQDKKKKTHPKRDKTKQTKGSPSKTKTKKKS